MNKIFITEDETDAYLPKPLISKGNDRQIYAEDGNETVLEALELFEDLTLRFTAFSEGESRVHPVWPQSPLWKGVQRESLWLWNGLRGGLIVPAVNMEVEGLSSEAFTELWQQRGADAERLKAESYFAYECMGLFEFDDGNAEEAKERLMQRVAFLLADAPALKTGNEAPAITVYDLAAAYREFSFSSNTCCSCRKGT